MSVSAPPIFPFTLTIERLAVPVFLGVGEEERRARQIVYVSVKLSYPHRPDATAQDASDYLCYDGLCQQILAVAAEKPVQLIEFLAAEIFRSLRATVPAQAYLTLKLHKPLPVSLVGYEVEGATVELTDMEGTGQ